MTISLPIRSRKVRQQERSPFRFGNLGSGGSGMGFDPNYPSFFLPLTDGGSGAVITTVGSSIGSGTPTFTRASTAWTKLASGLWASVATGVVRFSYIGQTTAVSNDGGYLSEGAGTQLVTPTASIRDMTDVSWAKVTMTTAKTSTGIDGVGSSCTRLTAAGVNSTILQTLVAAATSRTYSCWVKRITGTGTILLKHGTATLDITASINSSTFTQVQLNANELNVAYGIQINTSTDAIDVDFNQFEAGGFATSPMATTGAARNADVLTYPSAGNISGTRGTAYAEVTKTPSVSPGHFINGGDNNGRVLTGSDTSLQFADGIILAAENIAWSSTSISKIASAWGASGANLAAAGVLGTPSAATAANLTSTILNIGNRAGIEQPFGIIRNVKIYSVRLTDAQLQAMTS